MLRSVSSEAYIIEKLVTEDTDRLKRIGQEPTLLERGLLTTWTVLQALLQLLGRLLVATGGFILRTNHRLQKLAQSQQQAADAAAINRLTLLGD